MTCNIIIFFPLSCKSQAQTFGTHHSKSLGEYSVYQNRITALETSGRTASEQKQPADGESDRWMRALSAWWHMRMHGERKALRSSGTDCLSAVE